MVRVALLATRNPANKITIPTNSVTTNARSSPRRPENVPLIDNVAAPAAIKTLPNASLRVELTCRTAAVVRAGFAPRTTLHADHNAPAKMMMAGTDDPTAARMRGSASKWSRPAGRPSGAIWPRIGVVATTPIEKPLNNNKNLDTAEPIRGPANRYTVPNASHGTFTIAPNMKNTRNEVELHPRPSAHHNASDATTNNAIAMDQANSWGLRLRNHLSRVLRPNASATIADAAAKAVFKVTPLKARGTMEEFVNQCTKE